ncbi:hypothetical protein KEM56_007299 [Ascosphaera pollenicola]|nr:hypothetical protein KEM56_007299 [Ascosphaera pollenicola]
MTSFTLNTGAKIPAIGLGTWLDEDAQEDAVCHALKLGYRHIDTAAVYHCEDGVGRGIKKSGVPREEIFITSKLWCNSHHPHDVMDACKESIRKLDCGYLDLFLMHYPFANKPGPEFHPKDQNGNPEVVDIDYVDTWKAMELLITAGLVKAIGISNFSRAETERLLKSVSIKPAVHQLELHPWLQQKDFVNWHKSLGILITGYSALGNQNPIYSGGGKIGRLIEDPVIEDIAKKHGKTPAQVALAWGINSGHVVLVKSKHPDRIKENFQCEFKLDKEDMDKLATIDHKRRFNDGSKDFGFNLFLDLEGKQN